MKERACRNCQLIISENICPNCKTTNASEDWVGEVIILDSSKSQIAKNMGILKAGRYALKVR